ncbi:MAG: NAD kinase [Bacteroidaceae bacterium]|nr:NAD kinase [Bacteroidaceae bacterium]
MHFAIFGNPSPGRHNGNEHRFFDLLHSYGDNIAVEKEYLTFLQDEMKWNLPFAQSIESEDFQADVVISIGGDGTFLRTAAHVGSKEIPMVGINTGHLGFLADITEDKAGNAIRMIHNGQYTLEKRSLLEISTDRIPKGVRPFALNDIAVLKHDVSSMISIHALVDGQPLTTYMADGLVVATPTGSTAYSLSVGGPVIAPGTDVMELTPVAPHSLTMRPLILQNSRIITLNIESRSHNFLLSIDGRSFSCPDGTEIKIRRAPFHINVIKPEGSEFFSTLREKMMWGADSRR